MWQYEYFPDTVENSLYRTIKGIYSGTGRNLNIARVSSAPLHVSNESNDDTIKSDRPIAKRTLAIVLTTKHSHCYVQIKDEEVIRGITYTPVTHCTF